MPIEAVDRLPPVYDIGAARKAGVSEDQILGALKFRFGKIYDYDGALKAELSPQQINDTVTKKINDPVGNWDMLKQGLSDARDKIIDFVKPVADSAMTIAGGVAATPETLGIGTIPAGLASGVATDALLQRLQSSKAQMKNRTAFSSILGTTPGSSADLVANSVQNEGVNEILGKVGGYIGGKVKSLFTPVDPELSKLGPTMSQYGDKPGTFSSLLENIWGHSAKQDAMAKSADTARGMIKDIIADPEVASTPINPADRFNIGKLNTTFQSQRANTESIGRMSSVQVPGSSTLPSGNVNAFPGVKQVEGPINVSNTAKEAQSFLDNIKQTYGDKPLSAVDQKMVKTTQGILDISQNGTKPIPFRDAFDALHGPNGDSGFEGMSNLKPGEINTTKDTHGDLADALDKDIKSSIPAWQGGGSTEALNSYNSARASAIQKQILSEGGNVQQLVQSVNGPIPQIDKALQNPSQTQKLLNTSNLGGLQSSNMRQDLSGYRLQQIWKAADSGSGTLNGQALLKEWNNPDFEATKDLLYSKSTQDNIGTFFKNVAKVSNNGPAGAYGLNRLSYRGIELGAQMLTGGLLGIPGHIGTFAAMEIPPMVFGKLFAKPIVAQTLQRLITSQPLEMSTQQAGRLIMGVLNGARVSILDKDGKSQDVIVRDGKVQ